MELSIICCHAVVQFCLFKFYFFCYILFDFITDFDTPLGGEVGGVEFGKLPFGACEEEGGKYIISTLL